VGQPIRRLPPRFQAHLRVSCSHGRPISTGHRRYSWPPRCQDDRATRSPGPRPCPGCRWPRLECSGRCDGRSCAARPGGRLLTPPPHVKSRVTKACTECHSADLGVGGLHRGAPWQLHSKLSRRASSSTIDRPRHCSAYRLAICETCAWPVVAFPTSSRAGRSAIARLRLRSGHRRRPYLLHWPPASPPPASNPPLVVRI
jgi:hypothetical protein